MAAAPEWRADPLTGRRVLISPARAERPIGVGPACPFCEGHEAETPPEVYAVRPEGGVPDGPGWAVRVVPNRYAALQPLPPNPPLRSTLDETLAPAPRAGEPGRVSAGSAGSASNVIGGASAPGADATGLARSGLGRGFGVAEVFLESPTHETKFRHLSHGQATLVLRSWRDRLAFWRTDGRLAFAQVFKNEGPAAGASVAHCHSQLLGIPFIPPRIAKELTAGGPCAVRRWLEAEVGGPRVVSESDGYVLLCPAAPRFPGETWIVPRAHRTHFEDATDQELDRLADHLLRLLARMARAFGDPDFNLIVKSAPFGYGGPYHWRVEVLPRTGSEAGWELATGLLINTLFPERAAEMLRSGVGTR